jgi:two-component system, OmpR family, phosphate regulon sensor histidine kinase PhoR
MAPTGFSSLSRLAAWAIGPCVPAWSVLVVLALTDRLSWGDALVAAAVILVMMAALVFTRLADFDLMIDYAERMLADPDAPAPQLGRSATARRLLVAITALRKLWAERRDEAGALAKSRQNILDSLPDPLFILDSRRRIVSTNGAARELFEMERAAGPLVGRDLAGIIRDPKVLEAADGALGLGKKKSDAEFTIPSPVERTFIAAVVPLTSADGSAALVLLHDQTERLKMDQMRADFVANASHELRTPLASVLGFTETLLGPAKDDADARAKFLPIMLTQAERMKRLIDDLLSLSRIELHEHTRPTEAVDIIPTLRNVIELIEKQAADKKVVIGVTIAPSLPKAVADSNELYQVFFNLLGNAVKYGGDKGVDVEVSVSQDRPNSMPGRGPCLKIAVRDYGEGIPREHLARLTERFYRVDNARSRQLGGTGLGLAIVKHITIRHRGALTIDSELGKGSTFAVHLPLAG